MHEHHKIFIKKSVKNTFIILGVIIVIIIASFGAVRLYLKWTNQYYFGQITAIGQNDFTIRTGENEYKTILLENNTTIRRGFSNIDLNLNQKVIVIGPLNQQGQVEAKLIRIVGRDSHRR